MRIDQETMVQATALSNEEGVDIARWAYELMTGQREHYDPNSLEVAALLQSHIRLVRFLVQLWEASGRNLDVIGDFLNLKPKGPWEADEWTKDD